MEMILKTGWIEGRGDGSKLVHRNICISTDYAENSGDRSSCKEELIIQIWIDEEGNDGEGLDIQLKREDAYLVKCALEQFIKEAEISEGRFYEKYVKDDD